MKIVEQARGVIPTANGSFTMIAYAEDSSEPSPHLALVSDTFSSDQVAYVRIHSECITGDLFGSRRCDCGEQLDKALAYIAQYGGVLIYLRQEGRGIGIINKLKAYNLQDDGLDTIDANTHLGFEPDERSYEVAIQILKSLGVDKINLLTNNPDKLHALENSGIAVDRRISIEIEPHSENRKYLETKKTLMGHLLKLE